MYIVTTGGPFTISIDRGDAWSFRYVWLNVNSTSLEEALSIVGKYKNILYDVISSDVPASVYGREELIHIMFTEPPSNTIIIDEAAVRIIGLNITSLEPANATLIIEITNPNGKTNKHKLEFNGEYFLSKYFYTKVLKSGTYTIRIVNIAEKPVVITLNIGEGIILSKRPYIYYGIVVLTIGIILGTVLARMQASKNTLSTSLSL